MTLTYLSKSIDFVAQRIHLHVYRFLKIIQEFEGSQNGMQKAKKNVNVLEILIGEHSTNYLTNNLQNSQDHLRRAKSEKLQTRKSLRIHDY